MPSARFICLIRWSLYSNQFACPSLHLNVMHVTFANGSFSISKVPKHYSVSFSYMKLETSISMEYGWMWLTLKTYTISFFFFLKHFTDRFTCSKHDNYYRFTSQHYWRGMRLTLSFNEHKNLHIHDKLDFKWVPNIYEEGGYNLRWHLLTISYYLHVS